MDSIILNTPTRSVPWQVGMEKANTGVAGEIALEIDNKGEDLRAKLVWGQYDANGKLIAPNDEINTIVSNFKKELWESQGGGTTDKDGLYSFDSMTNTFKNYVQQSRDKLNLGRGSNYSDSNYETWNREIDPEWNLNSDKPLFNQEDLQHTFIHADITDRMEFLMTKYPDIPFSKILEHSISKHQQNKNANQWMGSLNIDNQEIAIFKGNRDKKLAAKKSMMEGLDMVYQTYKGGSKNDTRALDAADLANLLRVKGWNYLTPPQKQRVVFYLGQNLEWIPKLKEITDRFKLPEDGPLQDTEVNPELNNIA